MTRRVMIGLLPSGNFGMRVSMPGVDVVNGNSAIDGQFSFDSDWTDMVKIHQAGIFTASIFNSPPGNFATDVFFPDLGYKPFMEIRVIDGNKVYDDRYTNSIIGPSPLMFTNRFTQNNNTVSISYLYIIYKVAVPTQ